MYNLEHYLSGELPPDLACQIRTYYRFMMLDDETGDGRFEDLFDHADIIEHFVIVERGLLISHADVSEHQIIHQDESYRLCGVGEMMTNPFFRHEGHGSRIVAAVTDSIRKRNPDIGMLFTMPELEPYYGSSGWIGLYNPGITFGDPAAPKFDDAFVMMLFISDKAKAHRADFERGPIYVGRMMW